MKGVEPMDTKEYIKQALQALRVQARTPAAHRTIAEALRSVADEHDALAAALERDMTRPAPQRVAPTKRQGASKGGRPGEKTIYLLQENSLIGRPSWRIRIGRGVYDDLVKAREGHVRGLCLFPHIQGRTLFLLVSTDRYAVQVKQGGVQINVSGMADVLLQAGMQEQVRYLAVASADGIAANLNAPTESDDD
jgi:hypothetical protein